MKALPDTWLCIECSEEVGSDFVYTAKQENLGKAGSLKLNYGGISVTKKRGDPQEGCVVPAAYRRSR